MSLSTQNLQVLQTVVKNENDQAQANHANDVATYLSVTCQNWIQANVQSRNLVNNVGFTPTPIPAPPTLTVYSLNTDTGEITASQVVDPSIPVPTLPPYVSASGNAFATLQPNLNSQEEDMDTVTLQNIMVGVNKILKALNIS